ncbi:helix-turn-helix domain-containing protein [Thauera sp.]|uniref:helix-turn-helix domain-containing protein n=1 Tax=Thauera sp. TaxID=1905334 RepID=UPI002CBE8A4A|nr:helix-turn-helix domain-containing protein [Thauera sp.]HRP26046.1 helix-turn-helix domain-containing protein [Thauera sp.]
MSHAATNWAIRQRGLKPAAKIVLWHLADRHNRDTGRCDPDQVLLAADCEMSRSTLNVHLSELEKRGLIRRVQRLDERTKRQLSTAYILAMDGENPVSEIRTRAQDVEHRAQDMVPPVSEIRTRAVSGKSPEPCPENGESRVRNPDTNLGREPGREPEGARAAVQPFEVDRSSEQDRFPEFWAAYPRKENRTKAEAEFFAATLATDADAIIAAARTFASAAKAAGQETRFMPLPATWLRDKRWTDQIAPPADDERAAKVRKWDRIASEYGEPAA